MAQVVGAYKIWARHIFSDDEFTTEIDYMYVFDARTFTYLLGAADSFFILLFSHNLKNALHPQSKLYKTKTYKSR